MTKHKRLYTSLCLGSMAALILAAHSVSTFAASPKLRKLQIRGVNFELVQIPPGQFQMGSETGDNDEKPVHRIHIKENFYMGKTEVTLRQFRVFTEATGYKTEAEKGRWCGELRLGISYCPGPRPKLASAEIPTIRRSPGSMYKLQRCGGFLQVAFQRNRRALSAAQRSGMGVCLPGRYQW
jgi:formylglycine-generating enzyme required for sulfatase activity